MNNIEKLSKVGRVWIIVTCLFVLAFVGSFLWGSATHNPNFYLRALAILWTLWAFVSACFSYYQGIGAVREEHRIWYKQPGIVSGFAWTSGFFGSIIIELFPNHIFLETAAFILFPVLWLILLIYSFRLRRKKEMAAIR